MPKSGASFLRDRKKEACRAEIYQSAIKLFIAKGYDQTTVEEIAEAANVSKATFFNYFPRKEEIIRYYREEMVNGVLAGWQKFLRKRSLTPLQKLKNMITVIGEQFENRREAAQLLYWRQLSINMGGEFFFGSYQGLLDVIDQVIEEGQKAGVIRNDISSMLLVENIFSVTFYQVVKWISDKNPKNMKDQLGTAFDLFVEGIKPLEK